MNWTKTPPTRPTACWWRASAEDTEPELCQVFTGSRGELRVWSLSDASRGADDEMLPCWGGEWCGPLVSVEEVQAAFYEGVMAGRANQFRDTDTIYKAYSRARRVVEGDGA